MNQPNERFVGILGVDYPGCKPSLKVAVNQPISHGDVLFCDRLDPDLQVLSPVTGTVNAIVRGQRRSLTAVVVEPSKAVEDSSSPRPEGVLPNSYSEAKKVLLTSGLWSQLRQRPFGVVPVTTLQPDRVFITVPDYGGVEPDHLELMRVEEDAFHTGLKIFSCLPSIELIVCSARPLALPTDLLREVRQVVVPEPSLSTLAGAVIHSMCTPTVTKPVFEVNLTTVIDLGRYWLGQTIPAARLVRVHGAGVGSPGLYPASLGQPLDELLVRANAIRGAGTRLVAGSWLEGRMVGSDNGYVGLHDHQLQIIRETGAGSQGWTHQVWDQTSWLGRKVASVFGIGHEAGFNGRPDAMLPSETLERVWPFGVPVLPLLRALLTEDDETAQALGALALVEADMAQVSWSCPAKYDYGQALRSFLDRVKEASE